MKRDTLISVRLTPDEHQSLGALREWMEMQSVGCKPTNSDAVRMCLVLSSRLQRRKQNHAKQKTNRTD